MLEAARGYSRAIRPSFGGKRREYSSSVVVSTSWPISFLLEDDDEVLVSEPRMGEMVLGVGLFGSLRFMVTIADVDVGSRRRV